MTQSELSDWQLVKKLWPFARPEILLFAVPALLTPFAMGLALVQPWLLKVAIDDHVTPGKLEGLSALAFAYLGAVVLSYGVHASYQLSLAVAGGRTISRLRQEVFDHLLRLRPAFFDQRPAGALLTRATSDVESLGDALGQGVVTIVLDVMMVVGVLAMMLWFDWRLTLVLCAVAPPLALSLAVCRRALRYYYLRVRETLSNVNAFLTERLSGVRVVQLFNNQKAAHDRFVNLNRQYRDAAVRSNYFDAFMYAVVDGTGSICVALMLWYATSDWLTGAISAGLLVAFVDYLDKLFKPLREFSGKIAVIQRAVAALVKIFGLLDLHEYPSQGRIPKELLTGRFEVRDLVFRYRPEHEDVLKGLSFRVEPGEVVAIVGPTGCGKTTVARLLTRAYDGYSGHILLDGHELSEIDPAVVRNAVNMVRQDVHLFPDTVRFNIDLGDPRISFDQTRAAAELVHAISFIEKQPDGWGHVLKERGSDLSVGQGQLLTFARTMAHDPQVVILDEATASVDSVTEALIQGAIANILSRKTVIVIAHRLSTITAADRILVMDAGKIIERGSHRQLMAQGGRYAGLVASGLGHEA
jgi:ATP-binding cassette subfamily B protein